MFYYERHPSSLRSPFSKTEETITRYLYFRQIIRRVGKPYNIGHLLRAAQYHRKNVGIGHFYRIQTNVRAVSDIDLAHPCPCPHLRTDLAPREANS